MSGKNKFEAEKGTEDSHMSSDWPYNGDNIPGYSIGLSSSAACEGSGIGSASCASDPVMNCGPGLWNRPAVASNVGFCGIDVGSSAGSLSMLEQFRGSGEMMRPIFDDGWTTLSKGGSFLPNGHGVLPRSLSQFPSDSGFIERAARFSCFGSGNFGDMGNSFPAPESVGTFSKCRPMGGGPNVSDGLRLLPVENEVNMTRASTMSAECGDQNGRSLARNDCVARSLDESRQGRGASSNESDEENFRCSDGQEEPKMVEGAGGETGSARGYGAGKRKRAGQNARANKINGVLRKSMEGARLDGEPQARSEQNPSAGTKFKASEKTEQKSQGTDTPKDEYIHVRARRGQATNSHSLAERVRREKISERMKFLQDLVPGCSKVTGKAVMLDEIINYVQSLQRQVEFLSMKLATVNPRMDFDIERLVIKDMFHPRAGPSSSLGFPPDVSMAYAQLLPSPAAEFQANLPNSANSPDLRRAMSSHLADPQLANMWDDELHSVVHMGFGHSSELAKSQELDDSHQSGLMKPEP